LLLGKIRRSLGGYIIFLGGALSLFSFCWGWGLGVRRGLASWGGAFFSSVGRFFSWSRGGEGVRLCLGAFLDVRAGKGRTWGINENQTRLVLVGGIRGKWVPFDWSLVSN